MKTLTVCFWVTFVAIVSANVSAEEKYTDRYDDIDVDEILNSKRLKTAYFHCLKSGEKCTPEGQKLREILPDALQTACSKCSEKQKTQARKIVHYILDNNPEEFKELEKVYDPDHIYRTKYADKIKEEGVILPD